MLRMVTVSADKQPRQEESKERVKEVLYPDFTEDRRVRLCSLAAPELLQVVACTLKAYLEDPRYPDRLKKERPEWVTIFHSCAPEISILEYLTNIFISCKMSPESLIIAMIYFDRLNRMIYLDRSNHWCSVPITILTIQKVFVTWYNFSLFCSVGHVFVMI